MSRSRLVAYAAFVPAAGFLWARATSSEGSLLAVLAYAVAGTVSGFALVWIALQFALVPFTRITAAVSAGVGLVFLTPLIAMLIDESTDPSNTSSVVLAVAAAGAAALAGASLSVLRLAGEAFDEWRD